MGGSRIVVRAGRVPAGVAREMVIVTGRLDDSPYPLDLGILNRQVLGPA